MSIEIGDILEYRSDPRFVGIYEGLCNVRVIYTDTNSIFHETTDYYSKQMIDMYWRKA